MRRYPLGRFSVSRIGLGAMQLPVPGTSSTAHLEENLAAAGAALDGDARQQLAAP
ncbi:MAG TPA: hypothetical protein VGF54_11025 [Streptosporangiaceae bacterium]|jgi:aryl-alcohol dehydrogenase-like predicted oxidoreductase